MPLLELPNIILPRKRPFRQLFSYYVDLNISFADAHHAVLMGELQLTTIYSFDRDVDPGCSSRPHGDQATDLSFVRLIAALISMLLAILYLTDSVA
ncbi:MAG: hypothetical protein H0X37_13490 [Herpetosiphonaceae bacterium]|nr:hypothetical protein [Herpetosiphonaceae bacterium]